ncbi:hypothetical protein F511_24967 [Dorcoceras hygrometricum]|uniref:Uncharacterized protein n=1 Tax=Dorcoceras hygrometricum TaxID=472368 RepID=A0A2Z7D9C3_9LAMI|nr:hypothetical protein F511_24967 [Dorcoceras hygrometricum]
MCPSPLEACQEPLIVRATSGTDDHSPPSLSPGPHIPQVVPGKSYEYGFTLQGLHSRELGGSLQGLVRFNLVLERWFWWGTSLLRGARKLHCQPVRRLVMHVDLRYKVWCTRTMPPHRIREQQQDDDLPPPPTPTPDDAV